MIEQIDRDFLEELEDIASQTYNADHSDFPNYLARWLYVLDRAPEHIDALIGEIVSVTNWDEVESNSIHYEGGVGHGKLEWPLGKVERLGAQQHLLRRLAGDELDSSDFAFQIYHTSYSDLTDDTRELISKVFIPHSAELCRYLEMTLEGRAIPASDRVVTINDNAPEFQKITDGLEALANDIEGNNSLSVEKKLRFQAEMRAGRIIIQAKQLRIETLKRILTPPLTYLTKKFRDTAVGVAAKEILRWLGVLITMWTGTG